MSLSTSILSLTMANTLKPEEKLTARNKPHGCMETESGSSLNTWEISPFFSYPSMSKKFQIFTALSSEHDARSCFVTAVDRQLIFLL